MHKRSCPAYGNYQPPYEECDCGEDEREQRQREVNETSLVGGRKGYDPHGSMNSWEGRRIATDPQPPPQPGDNVEVVTLVMADLALRKQQGLKKYGTTLQPHNGRDPLIDAYQEALDLCQYLRQGIYERYGQ